jgi:hypothetical protein
LAVGRAPAAAEATAAVKTAAASSKTAIRRSGAARSPEAAATAVTGAASAAAAAIDATVPAVDPGAIPTASRKARYGEGTGRTRTVDRIAAIPGIAAATTTAGEKAGTVAAIAKKTPTTAPGIVAAIAKNAAAAAAGRRAAITTEPATAADVMVASAANRLIVGEAHIGERHVCRLVDEQRAARAHAAAATVAALRNTIGEGEIVDRDVLSMRDDRTGETRVRLGRSIDPDHEDAGGAAGIDRVAVAVDGDRIEDR